jgi:hypothetical protein
MLRLYRGEGAQASVDQPYRTDDGNYGGCDGGINACKLLNIAFTTAVGILIRLREKGLLEHGEALAKLETLAKYGRYKTSIMEDARTQLEALR